MAVTPKVYQVQPGTTDTDIVPVVAANKRFTVTTIIAGNTNTATKKFNLNRVPSGQAPADGNLIGGKDKKLVGTGDSSGGGEWVYEGALPLNAGDKLTGIQETAGAISVMIVGLEEDI